jgi:hypothetical protein
MKDTQLKKLTRVVRKLAAEVSALRKLIHRELLGRGEEDSGRKGDKKRKKKGRKKQEKDAAAQREAGVSGQNG